MLIFGKGTVREIWQSPINNGTLALSDQVSIKYHFLNYLF